MIIFDIGPSIMRLRCDQYSIDFWIELKMAYFDQVDYMGIEPVHLSKPNIHPYWSTTIFLHIGWVPPQAWSDIGQGCSSWVSCWAKALVYNLIILLFLIV